MTWLGILKALVLALGSFASWMRNRQLIEAGRAEAIAVNLKAVLDEIAKADAARDGVRRALERDPSSGCATMTDLSAPTEAHASFCAVAKPILWSARDTDETIAEVKEHNAVGAVLCGWK